jgi:predicted NodU family carbamoyl transferase
MVLDPKTAIETFLDCEMDTLVIHNYIIKKKILYIKLTFRKHW